MGLTGQFLLLVMCKAATEVNIWSCVPIVMVEGLWSSKRSMVRNYSPAVPSVRPIHKPSARHWHCRPRTILPTHLPLTSCIPSPADILHLCPSSWKYRHTEKSENTKISKATLARIQRYHQKTWQDYWEPGRFGLFSHDSKPGNLTPEMAFHSDTRADNQNERGNYDKSLARSKFRNNGKKYQRWWVIFQIKTQSRHDTTSPNYYHKNSWSCRLISHDRARECNFLRWYHDNQRVIKNYRFLTAKRFKRFRDVLHVVTG